MKSGLACKVISKSKVEINFSICNNSNRGENSKFKMEINICTTMEKARKLHGGHLNRVRTTGCFGDDLKPSKKEGAYHNSCLCHCPSCN